MVQWANLLIFCSVMVHTHSTVSANENHSSTDYSFHSTLDPNGKFQIDWKFDEETITFRVEAPSKGWAAIGFSPTGGMGDSDIVVFWIDGAGKGVISDRHGTENGFPPEDAKQDYTLIGSSKNETHLIATFSRKRNTCDKDDWALTDDTTRIIYAFSDAIPESKESFKKHTVRGSKSVRFFEKKSGSEKGEGKIDKDAKALDIGVKKVAIPETERTLYYCLVQKIPKANKKVHIIRWEPAIDSQNTDVVHHMLVYICSKSFSKHVGLNGDCFDGNNSKIFGQCMKQVLAVWAIGGQPYNYPEDIGMPLYNDVDDMYVMIEMHYDNAQLKKGKFDSSSMRFWTIEKLRPIEAGQAVFGVHNNPADQYIPPKAKEFTNYGYCSADCTKEFPKDGIKILGGLLHTHLAGKLKYFFHKIKTYRPAN